MSWQSNSSIGFSRSPNYLLMSYCRHGLSIAARCCPWLAQLGWAVSIYLGVFRISVQRGPAVYQGYFTQYCFRRTRPRYCSQHDRLLPCDYLLPARCSSLFVFPGHENARRDRVEGGRPPSGEVLNVVEEHDLARGFRYML
jgi:hypothetical protein